MIAPARVPSASRAAPPEIVRAFGPGERNLVGGENHSPRAASHIDQAQDFRREMDAIGNHRRHRNLVGERRRDDAGVAMIERPHRIEQMGEHARARRDTRRCLLEGRIGVADRYHHLARGQPASRLEGSGQFRREGYQLQMLQCHHALECFTSRLEVELRMRAESQRRDEGSFEMQAENPGASGRIALTLDRFANRAMNVLDAIDWRGDCGWQPCRGALAREPVRYFQDAIRRCGHHVDPMRAVDLQIDEAGQNVVRRGRV